MQSVTGRKQTLGDGRRSSPIIPFGLRCSRVETKLVPEPHELRLDFADVVKQAFEIAERHKLSLHNFSALPPNCHDKRGFGLRAGRPETVDPSVSFCPSAIDAGEEISVARLGLGVCKLERRENAEPVGNSAA